MFVIFNKQNALYKMFVVRQLFLSGAKLNNHITWFVYILQERTLTQPAHFPKICCHRKFHKSMLSSSNAASASDICMVALLALSSGRYGKVHVCGRSPYK
jgi:hypothetical protein